MLKNYLKIAIRNLWRNKLYTTINILGLAFGMTCAILLYLYIEHELSYESCHTKGDRTHIVATEIMFGENSNIMPVAAAPLAPVLQKKYPEIEATTRVFNARKLFLNFKNKRLYENGMVYAEPSYFTVFTQPFIAGSAQVLNHPKSLVLTQSLAKKIFGNARSAMNKSMKVGEKGSFTVRGIVKDSPENSHLSPTGFISLNTQKLNNWMMMGYRTYVLLKEGTNAKSLEAKLPVFVKKHLTPQLPERIKPALHLYAIKSIHFNPKLFGKGSLQTIYLFSVIAIFILLIAAINYMNLATTKSTERAKEIGIRKVVGSHRYQIIRQFMAEAVLLTLLSLVLSLSLVELSLPFFNQLAQKSLSLDFSNLYLIGVLSGIALFVGIISGLYPAFYLSSFNPIMVLKGKFGRSRKGAVLRKSLVVVQFTVSVIMIVGTLIVYKQMSYVKNKDIGFDRKQVLVLDTKSSHAKQKVPVIKRKLLENPQIQGVSAAMGSLADHQNKAVFVVKNDVGESGRKTFWYNNVDVDFVDLIGVRLIKGRNFSAKMASDSNAVIVNETLVKQMGWENPIGKKIGSDLDSLNKPARTATVIGVVKDFHYNNLYNPIEPYTFWLNTDAQLRNYLLVKIKTADVKGTLAYMDNVWQEFEKTYPLQSSFLEQNFLRSYQADERRGTIFLTFSALAIFIACMGLFALAAYTVNQRLKEIGIRKVLGASASHLVRLIASDFIKLIVFASLIAFPIAWYFMNTWLQNFAYRISIGWFVFAAAGGLALLVALLTVGTQAIKATLVNPVEVLKDE